MNEWTNEQKMKRKINLYGGKRRANNIIIAHHPHTHTHGALIKRIITVQVTLYLCSMICFNLCEIVDTENTEFIAFVCSGKHFVAMRSNSGAVATTATSSCF